VHRISLHTSRLKLPIDTLESLSLAKTREHTGGNRFMLKKRASRKIASRHRFIDGGLHESIRHALTKVKVGILRLMGNMCFTLPC
jgi:hypothetical protein